MAAVSPFRYKLINTTFKMYFNKNILSVIGVVCNGYLKISRFCELMSLGQIFTSPSQLFARRKPEQHKYCPTMAPLSPCRYQHINIKFKLFYDENMLGV